MTEDRRDASPVYLITGATSGIGLETARALARQGGTIVMVGHRPERDEAIVESVRREAGAATIGYLQADLSAQADVRKLAVAYKELFPRLDVLINNVGAYFMGRRVSPDGIEMTLALNHLNVFLLTCLLLDELKASAPARIVNVASDAHQRSSFDFSDPQQEKKYRAFRAYGQSKTAMIMMTYVLARRLEGTGVTANALHPGFVGTNFYRNLGCASAIVQFGIKLIAKTPEEGASTVVYLASDPGVADVNGKYFVNKKPIRSANFTYDEEAQQRLWAWTVQMVGCGEGL